MIRNLNDHVRSLPELREDIRRSIATEHAHLRRGCAIISAWDTLARVDEEINRRRPQ